MVNTEIKQIILRFADAILTKGIHIDKVVLYGSYVTGKAHKDSDIDVAVISPDFGRDRLEEGKILFQIAWRIDPRLGPIPISSESYENDAWIPLIYEVKQKGVEIYAGGRT